MINKALPLLKKIWSSKTTQKILTIGSIIITTGILSWLIFSQWDLLKSQFVNFRPSILVICFLIYSVILLLTSSVWAEIMNKLGHKVAFSKHFLTFCISALGKRLPGTLWYIVWRANLYKEDGYSSKFVLLTSGVEMVTIVIAAVIVSLMFSISLISQFNYSIIGFLIIFIASILFLHPKIQEWIFTKLNVDLSRFSYKAIINWTLRYIFIWILIGSLLFSFGNLFSRFPISKIGYFIGATALTGVLSRLFLLLPSHFGFGEVSLSLLLSGIMPTSLAVITALTNRILITCFEIIWAVVAIGIRHIMGSNNPK